MRSGTSKHQAKNNNNFFWLQSYCLLGFLVVINKWLYKCSLEQSGHTVRGEDIQIYRQLLSPVHFTKST